MRYVRNGLGCQSAADLMPGEQDASPIHDARFSNPVAERISQVLINRPRPVLAILTVVFILSAVGALELEAMRGPPRYMRSGAEANGFPSSRKSRDVVAIWCSAHCDGSENENRLLLSAETSVLEVVQDIQRRSANRKRQCDDLSWASESSPSASVQPSAYVKDGIRMVAVSAADRNCIDDVRRSLQTLNPPSFGAGASVSVALGGLESVARASLDQEGRDAWAHMAICVPFVLAVLAIGLGNIFRPLTALVCMFCTFTTTRAILVAVKKIFPSVNVDMDDQAVFFISFALNADYALFFWSRFREERSRSGEDDTCYNDVVQEAHLKSGTVITVSNIVMVFALSGTILFPGLNASGQLAFLIECLSGVLLAGFYSLTLTPVLASLSPHFFDESDGDKDHRYSWFTSRLMNLRPDTKKMWRSWSRMITSYPWFVIVPTVIFLSMTPFLHALSMYTPNLDVLEICANHETVEYQAYQQIANHFNLGKVMPLTFVLEARDIGPATRNESFAEPALLQSSESLWLPAESFVQLGSKSEAQPAWVETKLIESSAFSLPAAAFVGITAVTADSTESANEATSMLQRDTQRYRRMSSQDMSTDVPKPVGKTNFASFLSVESIQNRTITLSPEFGLIACKFVEGILNDTIGQQFEIHADDVLGVWWIPGAGSDGGNGCALDLAGSRTAATMRGFDPEIVRREVYRRTSYDGTKQQLEVYPKFPPTGQSAVDLSNFFKSVTEPAAKKQFVVKGRRYEFRATHSSIVSSQLDLAQEMGHAAPWICGLVCLAGFVTVGLTFNAAFLPLKLALTVVVPLACTYGIVTSIFQLGWLRFLGIDVVSGGPDPLIMYTTPCCLFGLAMDYDLFLFVRVWEYRQKAYDNRSAVSRALVETGPVITTAGVLFAVSLIFLTMSKTPFMQFLGAIYLTGICLDVFVVRTCIAPAFLCMAEELNYWPARMPIPKRRYDPCALFQGSQSSPKCPSTPSESTGQDDER